MNIQSIIRLVLVALAFVVVSSSCLEITTETTINKDGSGDQIITMDMAKMVEQMGPMMFEGETPTPELFKEKMGAEMLEKRDSMVQAVNAIEGLSNFDMKIDGYSLVMNLNFDDIEDLKKFQTEENKMASAGNNLKITNEGKTSVLSWTSSLDDVKKAMGDDVNDEMMAMMKGMFEGANLTSIYHLPGKVKKVSDKNTMVVTKDKMSVKYQVSMLDFLDGKLPADNSIIYKN
ncbi:MAG: hypothetical protein R3B47_08010 [Bacteroidia bacterium]